MTLRKSIVCGLSSRDPSWGAAGGTAQGGPSSSAPRASVLCTHWSGLQGGHCAPGPADAERAPFCPRSILHSCHQLGLALKTASPPRSVLPSSLNGTDAVAEGNDCPLPRPGGLAGAQRLWRQAYWLTLEIQGCLNVRTSTNYNKHFSKRRSTWM